MAITAEQAKEFEQDKYEYPLSEDELYKRYEDANWKPTVYLDDGLDGPNMSGSDYLILKAK